jgi:hypothetical protein
VLKGRSWIDGKTGWLLSWVWYTVRPYGIDMKSVYIRTSEKPSKTQKYSIKDHHHNQTNVSRLMSSRQHSPHSQQQQSPTQQP